MLVERLAGNALGSAGDDFAIVQWSAEVGDDWIAPLHVHHVDDEAWYILAGTLGFRLGEEEFEVGAGSAVLGRRGTPHTYRNAGDTDAEYLLVMPPRIASLIEAIHRPNANLPALFATHESEILQANRPPVSVLSPDVVARGTGCEIPWAAYPMPAQGGALSTGERFAKQPGRRKRSPAKADGSTIWFVDELRQTSDPASCAQR